MDEILTFEETLKYLKFSKTKLYGFVQKKKIPASKVGRNWRFKKVKIDEWLDKLAR
jgi:excisionase family DNA binding protein